MKPSEWFGLGAVFLVVGLLSWVSMSGDNFTNNAKLIVAIVGIGGGALLLLIGAVAIGVKSGTGGGDVPASNANVPLATDSVATELATYGELLERGLITREEYDAQKRKLLGPD